MKIVFDTYTDDEVIPVRDYLKNKKLKKYFNRETAASIVAVGKLLEGITIDETTPFYFALGAIEFNLIKVAEDCLDENSNFSNYLFVNKSYENVSPLTQLKFLQNMPLSFVSIEYNLKGDNAVIYSSASSLLNCVLNSDYNQEILIGAGKTYFNQSVEVGFALLKKEEIQGKSFLQNDFEAINLFKNNLLVK